MGDGGWKRVLLTAQRIWKRVERTCQIHRDDLTARVRRLTTRGGLELWNPHHYLLGTFERKAAPAAQGAGQPPPRQARTAGPSQSTKRMYNEMVRTYDCLEDNLGALRQIASKKMRSW